jgi:hypothetical protein
VSACRSPDERQAQFGIEGRASSHEASVRMKLSAQWCDPFAELGDRTSLTNGKAFAFRILDALAFQANAFTPHAAHRDVRRRRPDPQEY